MHEAGEAAQQHAAAEAEGHAHMLEVGFVDRGGVIGEATEHFLILPVALENGLPVLRRIPEN